MDGDIPDKNDVVQVLYSQEYEPWGNYVQHESENSSSFGIRGARAALLNDHVAVILGGRAYPTDEWKCDSRLDLFDLEKGKWISAIDIEGHVPIFSGGHSATRIGSGLTQRVVIFGGERQEEPAHCTTLVNDCLELTLSRNVLRCTNITATNGPSECAWHGATNVVYGADREDALLIMGGKDSQGKFLSDIWVLVFAKTTTENAESTKWISLQPTGSSPLPLAYHSLVSVEQGTRVIVIGGRHDPSPSSHSMLDSIFILDLVGNSSGIWSQVTFTGGILNSDILARSCHTAVELKFPHKEESQTDDNHDPHVHSRSQILIFGGFSQHTPALEPCSLTFFDHESGTLRQSFAPHLGLKSYLGHASVVTSDFASVFCFGGMSFETHEVIDTTTAIHVSKSQARSENIKETDVDDVNNTTHQTKTYENGDIYTGELVMEEKESMWVRHGRGTMVYSSNGGMYQGEWRDDQRWGQGVMTYGDESNGATYSGQWEADQRHGYGIYEVLSPKNDQAEKRYAGEWTNDQRHGKGTVTYVNGAELTATWNNNEVSEQEKKNCRLENGRDNVGIFTYVGEIRNGMPHGHGSCEYETKETYVGSWYDGKRSGHGISTFVDGTTYTGEWKNGKRNGFGKCIYARTRDEYQGKWVGDVRCGHGICRYANGSEYDGSWLNDECHGMGKFTNESEGTEYHGHWTHNKFEGDGAFVLDGVQNRDGSR